ncbi:hypothetical protein DQM68_12505 [Leptospira mayottensis]|nr:hypothetical protein DQM68_12505 [Leptospira mayottensis]AZQ02184.1 hypothetical protein LEP1GSC190_09210 [Leptospira mayottensis 200901116]
MAVYELSGIFYNCYVPVKGSYIPKFLRHALNKFFSSLSINFSEPKTNTTKEIQIERLKETMNKIFTLKTHN